MNIYKDFEDKIGAALQADDLFSLSALVDAYKTYVTLHVRAIKCGVPVVIQEDEEDNAV